jgi:hypothetical protein
MSDGSTILALLTALTEKVDKLTNDVAVLNDRRSDTDAQNDRIDKLEGRVGALEKAEVARNARSKLLAGLAAAGGSIGGAGIVKLLALLGAA